MPTTTKYEQLENPPPPPSPSDSAFDPTEENCLLRGPAPQRYHSVPGPTTPSSSDDSSTSGNAQQSLPYLRHAAHSTLANSAADTFFNAHREHRTSSRRCSFSQTLNPLPKPRLNRKQLAIIFSLIYGNFWVAACVSIQAPFFPKEAEMKGATPSQYGFVFGIYELMILLTSPLFGKLVTKVSPVAISKFGLLCGGASVISFGFIDRAPPGLPFILLAYAIRIIEGVSASAFMTSSYTVMAAKFPNHVAITFSYLEAAFVGPTLGGALYELGGFTYPFLALGAFLLAGCFVILLLLPASETKGKLGLAGPEEEADMLRLLTDGGMIYDALAIITALNFIGFNGTTLEPHLRQFDLSPFVTGLIFIINGATYALSTPFWGYLCEHHVSPKVLIIFGSVLCCLGLLFLGPVPFIPLEPSLPLIILGLVLTGFGMSAKLVCSFIDSMSDSIKRLGFKDDISTYGMVSAMFFTSCSVGAFVGPSAGGILLETLQYRASTVVILAVDIAMVIGGLLFLCCRKTGTDAGTAVEGYVEFEA